MDSFNQGRKLRIENCRTFVLNIRSSGYSSARGRRLACLSARLCVRLPACRLHGLPVCLVCLHACTACWQLTGRLRPRPTAEAQSLCRDPCLALADVMYSLYISLSLFLSLSLSIYLSIYLSMYINMCIYIHVCIMLHDVSQTHLVGLPAKPVDIV